MAFPVNAESSARITAAQACLADYQRAAATADVAERAMLGARVADMLGYLLAVPAGQPPAQLASVLAVSGAELASRRTMARALAADFRHVTIGAGVDDVGWSLWALRLVSALESVLAGLEQPPREGLALTVAQRDLILAALDDAAEYRTERASWSCLACGESPTEVCSEHESDLDAASSYKEMITELQEGES
jgi:hypothetical protein